MKKPEGLDSVAMMQPEAKYRANKKSLRILFNSVLSGILIELQENLSESVANRTLTEIILQQEYFRTEQL